MTTIAEEQGNSHSVYNPLLTDTTAVHNAQNVDDVKEVKTSDKQLQTHDHVPTIQESQMTSCSKETVEVHSLCDDTIEIFDTDAMPTKGPSPVISNPDDISLLTQKISRQKSYSVTINIPHDGSGGVPTLAEVADTHDQYINPSCDEAVKLQRNPAYVTVSDECRTTGTIDEAVKLQRNPAYVTVSDECRTTGTIDEAVKLQRNPAYIPINRTSSEIYLYEEIPYTTAPITSGSSSTNDPTIKMEKIPAYHLLHSHKPYRISVTETLDKATLI